MTCFNCGYEVTNLTEGTCPNCLATINETKTNFISYIGSSDSLIGYQKSYKLVLLKYIIMEYLNNGTSTVTNVIDNVREFYINRKKNGLSPDYNVDSRIENIENSSNYDVFAVMKNQPYKVINEKGYLYINRNFDDKLVFVFNDIITQTMQKSEWEKLLEIIVRKIELYYSQNEEKSCFENKTVDFSNVSGNLLKIEREIDTSKTKRPAGTISIYEIASLSNRTKNSLMRNGIISLDDLCNYVKNNDLSSLRHLGQKTQDEIEAFFNEISCDNESSCSIETLFNEDKYKSFVDYCIKKGITKLSDLDDFDFSILMSEPGYGASRVNSIISKYKSIKNNIEKIDEYDFTLMQKDETIKIHDDNVSLDISFLVYANMSSKDIYKLQECGYQNFSTLIKSFTKYKSIKIFGDKKGIENYEKFKIFQKHINQIAYEYLNEYRKNVDFNFFIQRANQKTLQAIAEQYNITRERVRQLEARIINHLLPLFERMIEVFMQNHSVSNITLQEVLDFFDDDELDIIIVHTLKNSKIYEYLSFAEMFVKKNNNTKTVSQQLYSLTEDLVGDGMYFFDSLPRIELMLNDSGFDYISTEIYLNFLIEINAHFYGDYVSLKKLSYSELCIMIIKKYFKNGIILNSDEDMAKLRKHFSQEFGNYKLPEQNRAIAARLAEHLIMCDKGKFKTIENIHYDQAVIDDIKQSIDNSELKSMYFKEIFAEFEGVLAFTSDIVNSYALHGILSFLYSDEYDFSRDSIIKKNHNGPSLTLSERIVNYVEKLGRSVDRTEIKQKIGGLSDTMLYNAMECSKKLIQWDYNKFNSMSNIVLSDEIINTLDKLLNEEFSNNKGYCSDRLIYEKAYIELRDFFNQNGIENSTNLFYLLQNLFGAKYYFSRPHICREKFVDNIKLKDIAIYLLDAKEYISRDEFADLSKQLMWSVVTSEIIFSELENEYTRITKDKYIINSSFYIDGESLSKLKCVLDSQFENNYISMIGFDKFDEYPKINYEWNTFLLTSIINKYDIGYKTISPAITDRRYNKEIIVNSDSKCNDLSDIVISLMKEYNITVIDESDLLSFLVIHHLVLKIIPKELYISEKISYADGYFYFK